MKTNIIYNKSCLLMDEVDNNSIDLAVTSPPYDNLRTYEGYNFDFEKIAKELYRVTKDGGVVVWVVGDATIKGSETGTSFRQVLYFKEIGFNLHDTMIYQKRSIPLNHNRYEQNFQYMFVLSKGKSRVFNPLLQTNIPRKSSKNEGYHTQQNNTKKKISAPRKSKSIRLNIWKYNVGMFNSTKDKIAYNHPAIFPDKLAQDHILSWSNENDIVLDPMFGSGTTLKMAKRLGRKYIGYEISKEYCQIAQERLA